MRTPKEKSSLGDLGEPLGGLSGYFENFSAGFLRRDHVSQERRSIKTWLS
jgi:hypothetical protein